MAKALVGYLDRTSRSPGHSSTRLTTENARLRARIDDLEALVLRLSEENDRLSARETAHERVVRGRGAARAEMQPA